jgi:hypothetical protein
MGTCPTSRLTAAAHHGFLHRPRRKPVIHATRRLKALCAPAAVVALLTLPAPAQGQGAPRGVNPKDNITKIDVIYTHDELEGDVSIDSLALKYDRALGPNWGMNIELPVVDFSAPGLGETGLGDTNVRLRYVENRGRIAWIGGIEAVAPTASEDVLGTGKWQLNPTGGMVLALSQTAFVFLGYKHILSIAGDDHRADLDQSQPRVLGAVTSPAGWWVLGDLKYTHDWENDSDTLDIEGEYGRMLSPQMALSLRAGTATLDSTKEYKVSLNWRYIL